VELECHYCYSGRGLLTYEGDYVCDNPRCGAVLEPPEEYSIPQPFTNKIVTADTDIPDKYTKSKDGTFLDRLRKIEKKRYVRNLKYVDREAVMIRIQQKSMVKSDICDICDKVHLNPEKVLNRFESYIKKVPINDMLKTDNIITNKRHKREPRVVAAGFVYNVFKKKLTIRQVKNAAGCGNKSLQKVLRLIT
jgi:hypothetical protein